MIPNHNHFLIVIPKISHYDIIKSLSLAILLSCKCLVYNIISLISIEFYSINKLNTN